MTNDPEFFYDVQQGSEQWFELRRGIPTASEFQTILANGKGRQSYLYKLAGEILTGKVSEATFKPSLAMERGKTMEAEARDHYARTNFLDVQQVGFVRRKLKSGRYAGCSPDSLIDTAEGGAATERAVLEIKTMRPDLMIAAREAKKHTEIPSEHVAQVMGSLWITGYRRADLLTFYEGMPFSFLVSAFRDEAYIKELEQAVEAFDADLDALVRRMKK